jgi:hypothetical protein
MTDSHSRRDFRWYQARLGFWQAIWGTLISGGVAVAIPAGVDAYRISQEASFQREAVKTHYIERFLTSTTTPDIEARIRFTQYFSYAVETPSVDV